MPQPKNQKRRNAIAGYQKAIDRWKSAIALHPAPMSAKGQSFITLAKLKIVRLMENLKHTQAKLGFGG